MMNVIERNEGSKIPYTVNGTKICIDDDLTINVAKRQADDEVQIDVCYDADGELVIGAVAGRRYVAQILIPAAKYRYIGIGDVTNDSSDQSRERIGLDMNTVTLFLWAVS